jgi:hypothetical protein
VTLELNRLTGQVDAMGALIVSRQNELSERLRAAQERLRTEGAVTPELLKKIERAQSEDAWRRGAVPLGDRLDETTPVSLEVPQAILIATDGSQIFPDRDAAALYYVINVGAIVFRVGSNQAPSVSSAPSIFYKEEELYNPNGLLRSDEEIGAERGRRELEALATLVEEERAALGGDLSVPIVALTDGPLLPWLGNEKENERQLDEEMGFFVSQMKRLHAARAIPVGYTDRPRSAYVLRILELIATDIDAINRESLRKGLFVSLADRQLFSELRPNERSALFAASSVTNDRYQKCSDGDRIAFFYANMARAGRNEEAAIARFEVPGWVAADTEKLNIAQAVVAANCAPLPYPYVLARAHELAVVTEEEKASLNDFLAQIMWRNGLVPAISAKAQMKVYSRAARR